MDFRYALRMLARTPGFTVLAVATLALGIGINTVVFTIYGSVAFRQLPVPGASEMVRVQWHSDSPPSDLFSWPGYERVLRDSKSFSGVIATSEPQTIVCKLPDSGSSGGEPVRARLVSSNYFDALGIRPAIGRSFGREDRAAVVVSHAFWQRKLHSDLSLDGKTLLIEGSGLAVVGVAPEVFTGTGVPAEVPDLWIPANAQAIVLPGIDWIHDESAAEWQILGRRKAGVSLTQTSADLAVLSAAWPLDSGKPVQLTALRATFFQTDTGEFAGFAAVCAILLMAVGLILLMVCVNLVNLIVARNAGRDHEIAVRLALGASRFRLLRQLSLESLLLGIAGGAAGLYLSIVVCGWFGKTAVSLLQEVSRGAMGVSLDFTPDWHALLWTTVLSVAAGLAIGVIPALRAARRDVSAVLKQGTAGAGFQGREARGHRNLILSAQIASCLVLLTGAGLLFRGVTRAAATEPDFEAKHIVLLVLNTTTLANSAPVRLAIIRRAVDGIQTLPGVRSVAWVDRPPFLGHGTAYFANEAGSRLRCLFNGVSDRYFETLGIPVLAGRNFTQQETEGGAAVAVVSESAARHLWPGASPLGRRISGRITREPGERPLTVIGVVKTVRSTYLSKADEGYVYMPKPLPSEFADLLIRTGGRPEESFRPLSALLAGVKPGLPSLATMLTLEDGPLKMERWMAQAPAIAASVLGGLALLLACLGIFGVVSRLVALRSREIGIRLVLGAKKSDVIALIGRQTLYPVAWGTAVGLVGCFAISGLLRSLIAMPDVPDLTYGAGAFDPVTFIGVFALLGLVVMAAAFIPVRRATLVEPAVALRDE